MRSSSRASRSTQRSTTPRPFSPTKRTRSPICSSRSLSVHSAERRPLGPRSPSPLPPVSPLSFQSRVELPSMDDDLALETILATPSAPSSHTPLVTGIPRSKRQPFYPNGNPESTPKAINSTDSVVTTPIEPLSIKKKTSLRTSAVATGSPTPCRRSHVRRSPLSRNFNRVVSPRKVSPGVKKIKSTSASSTINNEDFERIKCLSVSTKECVSGIYCARFFDTFDFFFKIEMSRTSIKRIKLEADGLKLTHSGSNEELCSRPSSPDKSLRSGAVLVSLYFQTI